MVSSVSRRIEKSLSYWAAGDAENCLINLFPAIDKVSKRRRLKAGVGERIRGFLADEERLITGIATRNILVVEINGMTFPQAMYKYGRTSVVHEGELDDRLKFSSDGSVRIGDTWTLSLGYIIAMIVAVIVAPESAEEKLREDWEITIFDNHQFAVNDIWGEREKIRDVMRDLWRDGNLFY